MSNYAILSALCLSLCAAFPQSEAAAKSIDAVLTQASFAGPQGFQNLCVTEPGICAPHPVETNLVHTPRLKQLLRDVQARVNASIEAVIEPAGQDHWLGHQEFGDCEDYALSKYLILRDAGLKPSDMRFAVAFTETDEYHAVLIVDTDQGSIVLDNRFDIPLNWQLMTEGGYRWIAAQERGVPTTWSLTAEGEDLAKSFSTSGPTTGLNR